MPIPLLLGAALIGGGATLGASAYNNLSQSRQNYLSQRFSREMYERQRADALADWNMQNAYNSPSQQMQRFKEAGLNPNLIYGQMTNSPVIRSSDVKQPDFVAPRIDPNAIGNIISNYYDIKQKDLAIKQQQKALEMANEQIKSQQMKNNYDSSFTYSTEVGQIKKQQLQENVDKTIEDWNMTRELRSMNPLKADQLKAQTENTINTIKLSNLDYKQRAATNDLIRRTMNQAMRIKGNQYELDKLATELRSSLMQKALLNSEQSTDITKDVLQLLKTLY